MRDAANVRDEVGVADVGDRGILLELDDVGNGDGVRSPGDGVPQEPSGDDCRDERAEAEQPGPQ
jgi:hypothetical protein